jgi:threonine dehydrogenase-like Zn-dependent dehydrogenase
MLAARAYEGALNLRLEDIERPTAGPGEVVVRIEVAGLANGMFQVWRHGMYPVLPRTLGHEGAGVVEEVNGVTSVRVGDRVRIHPFFFCGHCEYCLSDREQYCSQASILGHLWFGPGGMEVYRRYIDGTLAEFVRVPAALVQPIPDSLSFEEGAKLHDAADALRATKVAQLSPGATVVITAATGVMGASLVRLAPLVGIGRIIAVGRSAERLALVQELAPGLVETICTADLEGWEQDSGLTAAIRHRIPEGPDVVFDFLEDGPGTWQAIASLRKNGTGVLMGANTAMPPIPTVGLMMNGWRIIGTRSCTRSDSRQVMSWIVGGQLEIKDLITHRFALKDISAAEITVTERREPTWMVVVDPVGGSVGRPEARQVAAVG